MIVFAIDPGPRQSAFAQYDSDAHEVMAFAKGNNDDVLAVMSGATGNMSSAICIESMTSYGKNVGADVFDTLRWCGRFEQAAIDRTSVPLVATFPRRLVKIHMCETAAAKDSDVRAAVIDRFAPTGGGREPRIGTIKNKGPLYGISKDVWQALALAITFADKKGLTV